MTDLDQVREDLELLADCVAGNGCFLSSLKTCGMCGLTKPRSDFHLRSKAPDGLKEYCKPCIVIYQRDRRARVRAAYFADKRCIDCGSAENLELDHIDRENKVGSDVWVWAEEKRKAEEAKCVVRCQSCHRERHAEERRRHGPSGYNRGCRCEVCKEASRARKRRQNRAREEMQK